VFSPRGEFRPQSLERRLPGNDVRTPVRAIDCARSASKVEKAICADEGLRRADEQFNKNYARLLERVDRQQRRRLIETQRGWLKQRDAGCAGREDIVACVADAVRRHEEALARTFSDGYRFGSVRLCCTGQTLRLGNKTLRVVAPTDGSDVVPLRLTYENKPVLEVFGWLEVDGRGGDATAEAVVVSTHDYGNAGCSDQYLLSVRAPRVEPLSVDSDPCWRIFAVKRNGSGLVLTKEASPGNDGSVRNWTPAGAATVLERRLEFAARRGTRMADFKPDSSPTDNEEFFDALRFAAPKDWRLMAAAFEHAYVRQDGTDGKPVVVTSCTDFPRACPYGPVFAGVRARILFLCA
jgi:uncharacterized protein YecT (DUF1311 family)